MPAPTCCTVKPGAWGQRDPASFLFPQGSFPPVPGLLEHIPCGWISAKPSGTMEASVVFTDSEKGGSPVSRVLTSSSFFACQGGTVAAQMNPKEEEVTIITEVSPRGLGVGGHCAPVTGAGEGGTSGSSRWVSRTRCTRRCFSAPAEKGADAVGTAAVRELQRPLLSAVTLLGQLVRNSDTRQCQGACCNGVRLSGSASVPKELQNEGSNRRC